MTIATNAQKGNHIAIGNDTDVGYLAISNKL